MGIFSSIRHSSSNISNKLSEGLEKGKEKITTCRNDGGENAYLTRAEADTVREQTIEDANVEAIASNLRSSDRSLPAEQRVGNNRQQIEIASNLKTLKARIGEAKALRRIFRESEGRGESETHLSRSAEKRAQEAQDKVIKEFKDSRDSLVQFKGIVEEVRTATHPDLENGEVHQLKKPNGEMEVFYKQGDKEYVLNKEGLSTVKRMTGGIEEETENFANTHIDQYMAHLEAKGCFSKINEAGQKVPFHKEEITVARELVHNEITNIYRTIVRDDIVARARDVTKNQRSAMRDLEEDAKLLHQLASNTTETATKGQLMAQKQTLESIESRLMEKKDAALDKLTSMNNGIKSRFEEINHKETAEAIWTKLTNTNKINYLDPNNMTPQGVVAVRTEQKTNTNQINKEINANIRKILLENNKTYEHVNQIIPHLEFAFRKLNELHKFMKSPDGHHWLKQQLHTRESWLQVARALTDFGNAIVNYNKTIAELAARVAEKVLAVSAAITR